MVLRMRDGARLVEDFPCKGPGNWAQPEERAANPPAARFSSAGPQEKSAIFRDSP
jgi:hypothetical protein